MLADPQNNRGTGPADAPGLLRVVRQEDDGVYIRGAKSVGSIAAQANEIIFTNLLRPDFPPEACVWASVPVATDGLKLVCREGVSKPGADAFDHPIASKGEESDQFIIFDDVFIPNDRLFNVGDPDLLKLYGPVTVWAHWHILTRLWIKAEIFVGTAQLVIDALGTARFPQVRSYMADLMQYAHALKAFVLAAENLAAPTEGGVLAPEVTLLTAGRLYSIEHYPRIIHILQELCGQGLVMRFQRADFENDDIGPLLDELLPGNDISARDKNRLMNFVWDLTTDSHAGRTELFENVNATPAPFLKERLFGEYDRGRMVDPPASWPASPDGPPPDSVARAEMPSPALLSDLCHRELELCRVRPGETVGVLSQGDDRADYAEAFLAAIVRLGATGFHVRVPESTSGSTNDGGAWRVGATPLAASPPRRGAEDRRHGRRPDLPAVLARAGRDPAGRDAHPHVRRARARPHPPVPAGGGRAVAETAVERLRAASELRFTNAHGTDVTYRLGAYPVQCQYGFTDEPGRWDHWPSGAFVYTGGHDEGVDGRVVIAPGDILLPFKRFVEEPLTLTIEGGRISAIEGGNDAEVVRDYMAGFDDERAYALSHIGWGLELRARWSGLATDPGGMGWRRDASPATFSSRPVPTRSSAA